MPLLKNRRRIWKANTRDFWRTSGYLCDKWHDRHNHTQYPQQYYQECTISSAQGKYLLLMARTNSSTSLTSRTL